MLFATHSIVGISIASETASIPLIIILGVLSHFILDALPHTDWGTWHDYEENFKLAWYDYLALAVDGAITLLAIWYIESLHKIPLNMIILGVFSATLVDLIDNVPFWSAKIRTWPVGKQLHELHRLVHFKIPKKYWFLGLLTQIIIAGALLCLLLA